MAVVTLLNEGERGPVFTQLSSALSFVNRNGIVDFDLATSDSGTASAASL